MTDTHSLSTEINKNLITTRREQAVCSSLTVAEHFHKRHGDVIRAIEVKILPEVSKEFNERNFASVKYIDAKGEKRPMYYMTRDGFTLLAMGFTGKAAMEWKIKYINAFNNMEKIITERSTPEFLELREQGKTIRRIETDAIKEFVEYATVNGSSHADWYYKAFTSMVNKAVGAAARGSIGRKEEYDIQTAERVIAKLIHKGIKEHIPYKRLYRDCRNAIETVF